jgi:hypothetical protein
MDRRRMTTWLVSGVLVAGDIVAGGALAGGSIAWAQSGSEPSLSAVEDPVDLTHGPGEEVLTGDTATRVEAAALEAVSGGTVIRVETNRDGAAYEAHVETADGSVVTVTFDEDLTVLGTIDGYGAGPTRVTPRTPRRPAETRSRGGGGVPEGPRRSPFRANGRMNEG